MLPPAEAASGADPLAPASLARVVARLQHELFDIGSELALPGTGYRAIDDSAIERLENDTTRLTDRLPPLKEFILPGGSEAGGPGASRAHRGAQCRARRVAAGRRHPRGAGQSGPGLAEPRFRLAFRLRARPGSGRGGGVKCCGSLPRARGAAIPGAQ